MICSDKDLLKDVNTYNVCNDILIIFIKIENLHIA